MRVPLMSLVELGRIKGMSLTALYKRRIKKPLPDAVELKSDRSKFNSFRSNIKNIYYRGDELLTWFDETSRRAKGIR